MQEFASASSMSICPCAYGQVTVSPPISTEPVQFQVRENRSGRFSTAALSVTTLKIEPGMEFADSRRLTYTPSHEGSSGSMAGGSAGSNDGVDTMHRISPVL